MSRNAVIASGVVVFHLAALWALQTGLIRKAAEVVIPVEILSELIAPPKPAEPPPPPPPPPPQVKREITKTPPPPRPQAIRTPAPPAPNAPTGSVEPPPPPAPVAAPEPPAPPAPPPPAPPAPPRIINLSEGDVQWVREPPREYPRMSARMGEYGRVVIAVYFNNAGFPKRAEIRTSSGYERLDQAARDAVLKSQITPLNRPGASDETLRYFLAPINFTKPE
ncbi:MULTISPECIES: energy transducer TonB [unclassified Variovorax]|uniref:energy transducer TonB n=1 Tax=unclassified Variovorax TaxID=663243 RepID=UPI001BD2305C|nr:MULTISPECIES: energy transducer TonB [unclassified Variovorax]